MIDLKTAIITSCIVHKLGNAQAEENCFFSKAEVMLTEQEGSELKKILCKPFNTPMQVHQFAHDTELQQHEMYGHVTDVFSNGNELASISKSIVQIMYRLSSDFSIKAGEVFFLMLDEITTEAGKTNGMAIVKMDSNTKFIKPNALSQSIELLFDKGLMSKNIEKACLILNDDYQDGFYVYPYEKTIGETNYWDKYFLQCKARTDEFRQTNVLLNTYREFVMNDLPGEEFSKKEKIDLVQNALNFMVENNDAVTVDDFINQQLAEPQYQEDYKESLRVYVDDNDVQLQDTFSASKEAIQFQRKKFRSIIKLDKNFHIYVHSNEDLIERGDDEKGKFYKVYFKEEL
jgi:37-kD nucleoid-associated bacterial protein